MTTKLDEFIQTYISPYVVKGEGIVAKVELQALISSEVAKAKIAGINEVNEFIDRQVRVDKIVGLENKYTYLQMKINDRIKILTAEVESNGA